MSHHRLRGALAVASTLLPSAAVARADEAKGTVVYQTRNMAPRFVTLVKGPDAVDASLILRELVFSTTDLGAKGQACKDMSCVSSEVTEGMTVDLDAGRRLNDWVALNGGRVQYSGTAAGGAGIDVELDAKLLKDFEAAH